MTGPGLRERKKQKTRWAIQEHALRLFTEQGYDQTTIEQIAAAAEISPSTFFRYFKTKEDLVIEDEYDPLLAHAMRLAPPQLAPVPALRHALAAAMAQLAPADFGKVYERTKLTLGVPALRARMFENFVATIDVIAPAMAERAGRAPDDLAMRAFAGACIGAWIVAIQEWVAGGGTADLAELMDRVLAHFEDGFSL
jgi:AcrR family transcriptional regulator